VKWSCGVYRICASRVLVPVDTYDCRDHAECRDQRVRPRDRSQCARTLPRKEVFNYSVGKYVVLAIKQLCDHINRSRA
jgi:hypothetical protein